MTKFRSFDKFLLALTICLFFMGGSRLLPSAESGANEPASKTPRSDKQAAPDPYELRLRIESNVRRLQKMQSDLEALQKTEVKTEPLVLPKKPSYPPAPVKKNSSLKLKMGEFEDEESFAKRVEAARSNDEKEYHIAEIAYRLQIENIDRDYESQVKAAKDEHARRLKAETQRVAKIKASLPRVTRDTEKEMATLREQIRKDEGLLGLSTSSSGGPLSLEPAKAVQVPKPQSSAPETKIRNAAYSTLPLFRRQNMSFEKIRIECRGTRFQVDTSEFDVLFDDITLQIKFDTLKGAQEFKTLSESGKLFCFILLNQKNLESESKFASPTWLSVWGESYHVPDGSFLFDSDGWQRAVGRKQPLAVLPGDSTDKSEDDMSPTSDSSETMEGVVTEEKTEEKEEHVRISKWADSTAPIRVYFGTVNEPISGIRITVQGQITIARGQEMAVTDPEPEDDMDLPAVPTHTTSLSNKINVAGANAGERRTISVGGVLYPFRWCPPGSFRMGMGKNSYDVKLTKGFWILETEVTQEMYRTITNSNPSNFRNDKFPVEFVTWGNCLDFCEKLSRDAKLKGVQFSLPTEAQWEYACRAGTASDFSFGNDVNLLYQFGNYCDSSNTDNWTWRDAANSDGHDKTAPVGSYKPNPWGIYDMHGNVWEWCNSRYGTYPREPAIDPIGPTTGTFRIFRGGSWSINAIYCRSAVRFGFTPDFRRDDIGFRICLVPAPQSEGKP